MCAVRVLDTGLVPQGQSTNTPLVPLGVVDVVDPAAPASHHRRSGHRSVGRVCKLAVECSGLAHPMQLQSHIIDEGE